MQSSLDCHVRHLFIPDRLVEHSRYINTVLVRYFPERSNNVPETCQLEGAEKMEFLAGE